MRKEVAYAGLLEKVTVRSEERRSQGRSFLTLCPLTPCTAFWDATRAFMLLAVLSCFAGVVLGLSAFANGTNSRRVRTGGIALVLSGDAPTIIIIINNKKERNHKEQIRNK